jgi:hypothetical protein
MFHCQLTARELAMRAHEVAIIKNLDHPQERNSRYILPGYGSIGGGRGCASLSNGRSIATQPAPRCVIEPAH